MKDDPYELTKEEKVIVEEKLFLCRYESQEHSKPHNSKSRFSHF
jgi:hypothetical protein